MLSSMKDIARGNSSLPKHFLPYPTEFSFMVPAAEPNAISMRLNAILHALKIQWQWKPQIMTGIGFTNENVWSRAFRRRLSHGGLAETDNAMDEDDEDEDD